MEGAPRPVQRWGPPWRRRGRGSGMLGALSLGCGGQRRGWCPRPTAPGDTSGRGRWPAARPRDGVPGERRDSVSWQPLGLAGDSGLPAVCPSVPSPGKPAGCLTITCHVPAPAVSPVKRDLTHWACSQTRGPAFHLRWERPRQGLA